MSRLDLATFDQVYEFLPIFDNYSDEEIEDEYSSPPIFDNYTDVEIDGYDSPPIFDSYNGIEEEIKKIELNGVDTLTDELDAVEVDVTDPGATSVAEKEGDGVELFFGEGRSLGSALGLQYGWHCGRDGLFTCHTKKYGDNPTVCREDRFIGHLLVSFFVGLIYSDGFHCDVVPMYDACAYLFLFRGNLLTPWKVQEWLGGGTGDEDNSDSRANRFEYGENDGDK